MAVTRYYSFGGEILAEETGGVRRDYLTDALGSVTATVTGAGAVENTYRYKPYGELLAKTGGGSDPRFLWNGQSGYYNEKSLLRYIRNRCYDNKTSCWIVKDKIMYLRNTYDEVYIYCKGNPIVRTDYYGLYPETWVPRKPSDPGLVGRLTDCSGGKVGNTDCNPKDGLVYSYICPQPRDPRDPISCVLNDLPMDDCIKRHEGDHRDKLTPCCKKYNECYKKKGNEKACKEKWENWFSKNRPCLEISAYQKTLDCMCEKLVQKGCLPTGTKNCMTLRIENMSEQCKRFMREYYDQDRLLRAEKFECALVKGPLPCPFK